MQIIGLTHLLVSFFRTKVRYTCRFCGPRIPDYNIVQSITTDREPRSAIVVHNDGFARVHILVDAVSLRRDGNVVRGLGEGLGILGLVNVLKGLQI